jgi:hypothetical protein
MPKRSIAGRSSRLPSCAAAVLDSRADTSGEIVSRETELGSLYAGLGDLFEDVLGDVRPALTPPRRCALEVALLLEDAGAETRRLTRAPSRQRFGALAVLAEDTPALVAIDDAQWFDDSTCTPKVYTQGQVFVDPGDGHVHLLRNETSVPAETIPVQIVPRDAERADRNRPAPGNCPF